MDQGSNMDDFPFTLTCSIRLICKWYHVFAIQTSIRNEFRVSKFYPLNPLKVHENGHGHWGPGCFEARQPQVASPHVERAAFHIEKSHTMFGLWWSAEFSPENLACHDVMCWRLQGGFFYHNRRFEVLQELEPIYNDECILLAVGLSRIARGEVVSFCVPAVFWWLLYTFIIFGNSSCIIFAVVRSTLLLLHFHLHSLFFRSYLVSLQYFDDFCSYAALVHVAFLLLCAVLCCFWAFICILCAFVISLCAHSILMMFFISSNNSCSIFALCVVLCWFCTCVCACCFFRTYLVSLPYFDGFYHIRQ